MTSTVTRLWTEQSWVRLPAGNEHFFSSPLRPDWLYGPTSILFKGYQGFFPLR